MPGVGELGDEGASNKARCAGDKDARHGRTLHCKFQRLEICSSLRSPIQVLARSASALRAAATVAARLIQFGKSVIRPAVGRRAARARAGTAPPPRRSGRPAAGRRRATAGSGNTSRAARCRAARPAARPLARTARWRLRLSPCACATRARITVRAMRSTSCAGMLDVLQQLEIRGALERLDRIRRRRGAGEVAAAPRAPRRARRATSP